MRAAALGAAGSVTPAAAFTFDGDARPRDSAMREPCWREPVGPARSRLKPNMQLLIQPPAMFVLNLSAFA